MAGPRFTSGKTIKRASYRAPIIPISSAQQLAKAATPPASAPMTSFQPGGTQQAPSQAPRDTVDQSLLTMTAPQTTVSPSQLPYQADMVPPPPSLPPFPTQPVQPTPPSPPPSAAPTPPPIVTPSQLSNASLPPSFFPQGGGGGGASYDDQGAPDDGGYEDDYGAPDDGGDGGADYANDNSNVDDGEDDMSGLDLLGAELGDDVGFSISALWKVMKEMKPMTKEQADLLLKSAITVTDQAASGLSGSDARKATAHADALRNTRSTIANLDQDPIEEGIATGIRDMVAQGFTYANSLAEQNAAQKRNLSLLWQDMKDNAANLPKAVASAASSALSSVTSGLKWVAIGAGVIVAIIGGVLIYKLVRR